MNSGRVATNISHIPEEGPDNFHENIRPGILIEWAACLDSGKGPVDGVKNLLVQHLSWYCGKIQPHLQNLFKIITSRNVVFGQSFLNSNTIKR
jgi:hypothetical protein